MRETSDTRTPLPHLIKDFAAALSYDNPALVGRYAKRHGVPLDEAQRLFMECKKFLIVCALFPEPCSPSRAIDQMWHHFILHTRDYSDFCWGLLGGFIHHRPSESPHVAHRAEMIVFAERLFGRIERDLWPKTGVASCDASRS